jgi:hypothetical protein
VEGGIEKYPVKTDLIDEYLQNTYIASSCLSVTYLALDVSHGTWLCIFMNIKSRINILVIYTRSCDFHGHYC